MADKTRSGSLLVTKILALGTLGTPLTPEQQRDIMPLEVPENLWLRGSRSSTSSSQIAMNVPAIQILRSS
jgi:hypothetical protein